MIGLVYFHTVNGFSLSESMRQVDGKMVSFKNKQDQVVLRKIQLLKHIHLPVHLTSKLANAYIYTILSY